MNPVRWWRSVLDWYRARGLFLKILLTGAFLFVAVFGIYVGVQTIRYCASDLRAASFLPDEADLTLQAPGLEERLERWERTAAWKSLDKRVLHHGDLRRLINEFLEEAGAPTLDDLEDRRFHDRTKGWLERDRLMRFLGRDLAVAVDARTDRPDFLVVTRLAWREAVLAPLGWLFSGMAGAKKVSVARGTALEIDLGNRKIWVALRGPLVLVAGSSEMLSAALSRSAAAPEDPEGIRLTLDFSRSPRWREVLQDLDRGPAGGFLGTLKAGDIRRLNLEGGLSGRDLVVRGEVDGWEGEPVPTRLAGLVPAETAGTVFSSRGLYDLWVLFQEWAGGPDVSPSLAQELATVIRKMKASTLETELLPLAGEGLVLVMGTERYEDGRDYPGVAAIFPMADGDAARQAADGMLGRLISSGVEWHETLRHGRSLRWLTTPVSLQEEPLLRLSVADVPDTLVVGNNPDLVGRIVDCWAGMDPGPGREALPSEGDLFSFRFYPARFRVGLEGMAPMISGKVVNNDRSQAELRNEMVKEGLSDREIDRTFNDRLEMRIESHSEELRRSFDPLRAVELVRVRVSGEGGLDLLVRMK